jgi:hypothetical protein
MPLGHHDEHRVTRVEQFDHLSRLAPRKFALISCIAIVVHQRQNNIKKWWNLLEGNGDHRALHSHAGQLGHVIHAQFEEQWHELVSHRVAGNGNGLA